MLYSTKFHNVYERRPEDPEKVGFYLGVHQNKESFIQHLSICWVNYSKESFAYDLSFGSFQISDVLKDREIHSIQSLPVEDLPTLSKLHISFGTLYTEGTEYKDYTLSVKNKTLLKKKEFNALVDCHLILLASFPQTSKHREPITIQKAKRRNKVNKVASNPIKKAHFSSELDLHAYLLVPNPSEYTATDIFILQLEKFEKYLDEAIVLGLDRFIIIHGVGKGRLKDEIHRRLRKHPFVKDFKNEFHPKYKFGATEVFL